MFYTRIWTEREGVGGGGRLKGTKSGRAVLTWRSFEWYFGVTKMGKRHSGVKEREREGEKERKEEEKETDRIRESLN